MEEEKTEKKVSKRNKARKRYNEKLELIKGHYGVEFSVSYFTTGNINKIRFSNLDYKKKAQNITIVYDRKANRFNYIYYEYDNETLLKNTNSKRIIEELNREKKLKLVVAEVERANNEYKLELEKINNEKEEIIEEKDKILEKQKSAKNE